MVHSQSDHGVARELDSSPYKGSPAGSALAARPPMGTLAESSGGHQLPFFGLKQLESNTFAGTAGQPRWPDKTNIKTFSKIEPPAETETDPTGGRPKNKKLHRNTERGIRSQDSILNRRIKRSLRRNLARRMHRRKGKMASHPMALEAQDLGGVFAPRANLAIEEMIIMTSLNAQGINKAEARILIETYMDKYNIDFMFVQDTQSL